MATIRIRFVANTGWAAHGIRAAQLGYPYTHVDVAQPDGLLGAHLEGGVQVRPVGYDTRAAARERWIALDVAPAVADAFDGFLRAQLGAPYDIGAITDFAWAALSGEGSAHPPGAWRDPDRWFCSELVAAALVHAGVLPGALADEARHVTPQCLMFAVAAIGRVAAA